MEQVPETRAQPRLRVYIAGGGKQLFQLLRDPGLKVYGKAPARDPTPDLVVFPCISSST